MLSNLVKLKIFEMRNKGESFKDIAKAIGGISAKDASDAVVDVLCAKKKSNMKPKIVYRKRLTTSCTHQEKLINYMRKL